MRKHSFTLRVVTLACLLIQGAIATPVSVLLEQGIYTEETVGDRQRAIAIYRRIVDDDSANRNYVAEALFRLSGCLAANGQTHEAIAALERLLRHYDDLELLAARARTRLTALQPKPLYPDFESCRLVYQVPIRLAVGSPAGKPRTYTFYRTDRPLLSITTEAGLEEGIDHYQLDVSTEEGKAIRSHPNRASPADASLWDVLPGEPGAYLLHVTGYAGERPVAEGAAHLVIKPSIYSQIGVNDIEPNGVIRFAGAQQTPHIDRTTTTQAFINSDFVHIEKMFDGEGRDVSFTEKHEGSIFRYRAKLNEPVAEGETLYLGSKGWSESQVTRLSDEPETFKYRMNHSPATGTPVRRVEIFRLPEGADLLDTTPADLPHRLREDGRIEILVDTIIPANGSLLTEFRFQLAIASKRYVLRIAALKQALQTKAAGQEGHQDLQASLEALDAIEAITAGARFHLESLVELAELVPGAQHNHKRIVKAAELASKFGYHTGALVEVARMAAAADRECKEMDAILDLVVLKLGGTPGVINLARQAAAAKTEADSAKIHTALREMLESADFQTLDEAFRAQKSLPDAPGDEGVRDMQPAPWQAGEILQFALLSKAGMEIGTLCWIVQDVEQDGRACWRMEQRLVVPSSGTAMASHVVADKDSFIPLNSHTTHQMGSISAQYLPGKVLLRSPGQETPREVAVSGTVYDNEQVIYLMRRLPLEAGYQCSFPIMSVLSGTTSLQGRIRVMARETIRVSSTSYDCWKIRIQVFAGSLKAVEQTAWFTAKDPYPVKFITDQIDMELTRRHTTGPFQNPFNLEAHGAVLHLPENWFAYELPAVGKGLEIVRLLPPGMKLEGLLCKTVAQPAHLTVQEIAASDFEVLKGYFKDFSLRGDSVVNTSMDGFPVTMMAADYQDRGKAKVEYRAYCRVGPRLFWWVFRMDADLFDLEKATLDAIIRGSKFTLDANREQPPARHSGQDSKPLQRKGA